MNGAAAKSTRRQVRRAFGEQAIGVIDTQGDRICKLEADAVEGFHQHKALIDAQKALIDLLEDRDDAQADEITELRTTCNLLRADAAREAEARTDFQSRGWFERMKWIWTGR
jgi:argininosuccinate synthase